MIPKKVTLENFLSFGEKKEVIFDDEAALWVVAGPNGVGKSAIFDAITYCLFEQHRNGQRYADKLTHHGRDGFSVSFEFEFRGVNYRINRNRLRKKATQSVNVLDAEGNAQPVPNVHNGSALTDWVVETLGLTYETFTKSVLLKQGESDLIVGAKGTERMELLKNILGVKKYETLSELAKEHWDTAKTKKTQLANQSQQLPDISEVMVAEAVAALDSAALALAAATNGTTQARTNQSLSVGYRNAEEDRTTADRKLLEHAELAQRAESIARDAKRCELLTKAVPKLRDWHTKQHELDDASSRTTTLENEAVRLKALLGYTEDKQRQGELTKQLELMSDVERLQQDLAAIPEAFATELTTATETVKRLTAQQVRLQSDTRVLESTNAGLLKQQRDFDTLGTSCQRCGQPVTAEHAENEKQRLKDELAELASKQVDLVQLSEQTVNELSAARKIDDELLDRKTQYDQARTTLDALRPQVEHLVRSEVQSRLDDIQARLATAESRSTGLAVTPEQVRHAEKLAQDAQTRLVQLNTEQEGVKRVLEELDPNLLKESVDGLSAEWKQLQAVNVVAQHQAWLAVAPLQAEYEAQLQRAKDVLAGVPDEARVSEQQATDAVKRAVMLEETARQSHGDAVQSVKTLQAGRTERLAVLADLTRAEKRERLTKKLHEYLGKAGLLRELVREAEARIVHLADKTLQSLSEGDLSLELNTSEAKDEEALVLQVRRPDFAEPTGLDYLSGSQKFRVAISIALAIGQFSSGQDRPLECVIIDEGFGSLDKDGLRTTADELNKLKKHLKRIILVSHQEEFTDNFPAVIQLKKGENGTQLERVYRGR
jgi:DNA repair protein SbcC/Rad50